MKFTVAIVLLVVFFACFAQADENTLFLSKLKKTYNKAKAAVSKSVSTVKKASESVKRVYNGAKNIVNKAKDIAGKAKDFAGKAKKAVADIKDKLMSFARYGNHCGKGHGKAGVPVKDVVDLACYHHDRCYEAFGFGNCGCDRDAIVEIKKALKTNVSLKAKASGRVGLIWLSKHGCDYVSKTADGTCTKGKNKNLKGSDNKLWYSCSVSKFTSPTAPNASSVIAKFYGRKAAAAATSKPAGLDREVKNDEKKLKKLDTLLGAKKKSGKKATGKKAVKRSGSKKATKRSGSKKATKRSGSKKSAGKKSGSKKATKRSGSKKALGKKATKLEAKLNKQINTVNKSSNGKKRSGKKASRKSRKGRKAGKRRGGCAGSGVELSFSGKTSISIGSVKI